MVFTLAACLTEEYPEFKKLLKGRYFTEPLPSRSLSAAWLLEQLAVSGLMRSQLALHTPAINEGWKETAEAVLGRTEVRSVIMRRVPSYLVGVIGAVAVIVKTLRVGEAGYI